MSQLVYNLGRKYYEGGASPSNLGGYVSKSMLWEFDQSPWKWFHSGPKETTPAMEFGSLVHCLALTPTEYAETYAVSEYDSFRTKAAQEWRDSMVAQGKICITQSQLNAASECAESILNDLDLQPLFVTGYKTEVAVYSQIGETKVRGMIDLVPQAGDDLVDIKTTSSIGKADDLASLVVRRGYHWQAALYLDLFNAATGLERTNFVLAFVETSAPYETAIVNLSGDFVEQGRIGYMNAIAKYQKCVSEKMFPKAVEGIQELSYPKWAIK